MFIDKVKLYTSELNQDSLERQYTKQNQSEKTRIQTNMNRTSEGFAYCWLGFDDLLRVEWKHIQGGGEGGVTAASDQ